MRPEVPDGNVSLYDEFKDLIGPGMDDLPSDLARHKRHYLYGHPKE